MFKNVQNVKTFEMDKSSRHYDPKINLSWAPAGYKDCTWPLLNFYIPTKVSHPYQV